jgi:hypothetical protein
MPSPILTAMSTFYRHRRQKAMSATIAAILDRMHGMLDRMHRILDRMTKFSRIYWMK